MTIDEVQRLQPGDEVFWTDPAEGECSRHLVIRRIHVQSDSPDAVVSIDSDDSTLECFAHELS